MLAFNDATRYSVCMRNKKFIVKDWTGKEIEFYGESDSFEDSWSKIYENFSHLSEEDFEEQMGEFYVEQK